MNIDLLFTNEGEAGLISNENLIKKTIGILLDTENGTLTFEFADMDHIDLNIPVEGEFFDALDQNTILHIGSVKDGHIAQAYQVPLLFSDDPYRGEAMGVAVPETPLLAFHSFISRCAFGQAVHREDLESEDDMGCILGDMSPAALEFAPHMERRFAMEAKPAAAPQINAPGMGLGGSGGGRASGGGYTGGHASGSRQSSAKGKNEGNRGKKGK